MRMKLGNMGGGPWADGGVSDGQLPRDTKKVRISGKEATLSIITQSATP
jgi:hypothetical protein